jgi:hypothetical protein
MATYDYQHLLDQTYPTRVVNRQYIKTRYEQTLSDFPNEVDLGQSFQENGLIILAEALSTAGTNLTQEPATQYRFALNNWHIEIDINNNRITVNNPQYGKSNSITNIKCIYNHIEFLEKLSDYENMHFDVYTKGRFRLSLELTRLLFELITNITNGAKYEYVSYNTSGLTTQITQEPVNTEPSIIFNGWLYNRSRVPYKFSTTYPVCELV